MAYFDFLPDNAGLTPYIDMMYEKWKTAGASAQVLSWIKEGGYTIQVGEDGRGIFRRNSVTARGHHAELVTLVLEVLIKRPGK